MGPGESGAAQVLTGSGESCPLPPLCFQVGCATSWKACFPKSWLLSKKFQNTCFIAFHSSLLWEMEKQKCDTSDTTKVTEGGGLIK